MNKSTGKLQNFAFFLISVLIISYLMVAGRVIVLPLIFAGLLGIMIQPVCTFLEKYIKWRVPSIFLSFIVVLIPISLIFYFFTYQLGDVIQNMTAITGKLQKGGELIFTWLNEYFGISKAESWTWIKSNLSGLLDAPMKIFAGLASSTSTIVSIFMTFIFIFFVLLYRGAIKKFIIIQFNKEKQPEIGEILNQIQRLVRKYLYGMLMVILILAILNSFGLWIIGLDYPVFWACLAALLSIIPYLGTTLGGLLPFMYAFATAGYWWQPLAVVALYVTVQQIEGNLITPYVVGSNVKINPFVALISLLIGGIIWGVAGIVLAIPIAAILKLVFDHVDGLKPLGVLMSSGLHHKEGEFTEKWNEDKFRITTLLKNKDKEGAGTPAK